MTITGRGGHLALGGLAVAIACLPLFASPYHVGFVATALVAALFALSLHLLVGGVGMISLGHAAFFGIGAYTVWFLTPKGGSVSILLTLPAAAIGAALASLVVGALALRTRGFFFLMTTLAFGQMLFFVFHDTPVGGGADGVFITRPDLGAFGWVYDVPRRQRPAVLLWLNLGILVLMYAGLAGLLRTLFGRALLGIRANDHRMAALGMPTNRYRLAAFVLGGALAGIAGHQWAMTEAFVSPELLGWHRSAVALLMIVLGGVGSLHGPILGALGFAVLGEVAGLVTERQHLVEGAVILVVVLALPRGLAGLRIRRPAPAPIVEPA
ncbi:MAG: branched-chain amino acid ABC transporter permease [Gemmatimonadaceae bacterium]|nr:branched-chain amino acid ABC transporter permease [Acetobacteraceae bacterium]